MGSWNSDCDFEEIQVETQWVQKAWTCEDKLWMGHQFCIINHWDKDLMPNQDLLALQMSGIWCWSSPSITYNHLFAKHCPSGNRNNKIPKQLKIDWGKNPSWWFARTFHHRSLGEPETDLFQVYLAREVMISSNPVRLFSHHHRYRKTLQVGK